MTNPVIPEAAVEAAAELISTVDYPGYMPDKEFARKVLEAAAPHMRQAFFLEMNLRAVQDELNTPLQFGRPTP